MKSSKVQEKKKNKIIKLISTIFAFLFALFTITGCTSTDKSETYMGGGNNFTYTCRYNIEKNETTVLWSTYIDNQTIYHINGFSVNFALFEDDKIVDEEEYIYDADIKSGKKEDIYYRFRHEGNINKIECISWKAEFKSLWGTYFGWFLGSIIGAVILLVAYILYMIIEDTDLDEIGELFEDAPWISAALIPLVVTGIYSIASSHWVPVLIILGGFVALFIGILIAHLIKYIIENVSFGGGGYKYNLDEDSFDDEEKLNMFSMENLKEYCRENDIKGYSGLRKSEIVSLIMSNNVESSNTSKGKVKKTLTEDINKKNTSKITFNSIAGLDQVKKIFREKVVLPFEHPLLFEKYGKKAGGGILLYGLPGTGKTMFAEAASNEVNALFIPIKCSDIKSKWYGESEQKVRSIFSRARKVERAIIFFDEFEAIGAKRTDNGDNGNNDLVPQILAEMQGVGASNSRSTIIVIAATNKPWAIDSAFMRPGRFDEKIYVPLPDFEARRKIFELQLSKLPVDESIDYDYLANITEGCNGADIKEVCEKLKMSAIYDSLEKKEEQKIGMDDVLKIESSIHSSVSQEDIIQLEEFEKGNY